MDARPEQLADDVRASRIALDNDLELLRVRMLAADPRRIDARRWLKTAAPIVAVVGVAWWLKRRRSSVRCARAVAGSMSAPQRRRQAAPRRRRDDPIVRAISERS